MRPSPIARIALEAEDWLRYRPEARQIFCRLILALDRLEGQGPVLALRRLFQAAVKAPDDALLRAIEERIERRLEALSPSEVPWAQLCPESEPRELRKSLILKQPVSAEEKGALLVTFEFQLARLMRHADLSRLAARYDLIFSPSYHPPHHLALYELPRRFPGEVHLLISNPAGAAMLRRISPRYHVVPLLASHWVSPRFFQPRPRAERDLDLLMVAGFSKAKRHRAFFRALRTLPRSLRVLLIGQAVDGRSSETIRREAAAYGVEDRFALVENPWIEVAPVENYRSVVTAMCRARASVILSRQEGSCIVVAESLFADTPVAMLAGAEVGSRAFINDQTGCLLGPGALDRQLDAFLRRADRYHPRAWAEENISCFRSIEVLNRSLREHARSQGRPWTQDLVPFTFNPEPHYAREEDAARFARCHDEFEAQVGMPIGITRFDWPAGGAG